MKEKTFERRLQLRDRRFAFLATSLAAVATLGYQNAELIGDAITLFEDNHEVPIPPGCKVADPSFKILDIPDEDQDPILLEVGGGSSAARSVPLTLSGSFEARGLHMGYFDKNVGSYSQPNSGMTFNIRSDREVGFRINEDDLQTAYSVAFENYDLYEHEAVREVMLCMYRDVFEEKKAAGQTVDHFIPSFPDVCMNGLFIDRLGPLQTPNDCHTRGFTMPSFTIRYGPFTYEEEGYMVTAGGNNDIDLAEERVAKMIVHETVHQYLRKLDTTQRLDPEERFVDYVVLTLERAGLLEGLRPVVYDRSA